MDPELRKRATSIGFNTHVPLAHRDVHVQTEVFGRSALRVVTTVTSGGELLGSREEELPGEVTSLELITEAVQAQHDAMVGTARQGGFDGAH